MTEDPLMYQVHEWLVLHAPLTLEILTNPASIREMMTDKAPDALLFAFQYGQLMSLRTDVMRGEKELTYGARISFYETLRLADSCYRHIPISLKEAAGLRDKQLSYEHVSFEPVRWSSLSAKAFGDLPPDADQVKSMVATTVQWMIAVAVNRIKLPHARLRVLTEIGILVELSQQINSVQDAIFATSAAASTLAKCLNIRFQDASDEEIEALKGYGMQELSAVMDRDLMKMRLALGIAVNEDEGDGIELVLDENIEDFLNSLFSE